MLNDVKDFSLHRLCPERSVVEQILEVQDFEEAKLKSFGWMARLICLTTHKTSTSSTARISRKHMSICFVLHEVEADLFDEQQFQYVTISYPWHPAPYESGKYGSFRIKKLNGEERPSLVRDTIIRRAVHYVRHHHLRGFWIDHECLDQEDSERHQVAMHSMDRLYARSPCSVGMLTSKVGHRWQLDALTALMDGSLFQGIGQETVIDLPPVLRPSGFWRVLKWFGCLLADPWWRRCWIFQEEYCAARKMFVLIPCEPSLTEENTIFGTMRGEIEIPAVDLRTQLTIFGLACQRGTILNGAEKHFVQRTIIRKAERYQTSYQCGRHRGHTLSSFIMADLQRRRIKYPRDSLAIAANCCAYGRRLDEKALEQRDAISLGLSLFVQALLNGEILDNHKQIHRASHRGFAEFFRQQIFHDVQPPMGTDTLTFFKHCRFPNVQLCADGIRTTGYLWQISCALKSGITNTKRLNLSSGRSKQSYDSLWTCLTLLAYEVESLHLPLANQLHHFTAEMREKVHLKARDEFMIAMAREVAHAWNERRTLVVGKLSGHRTGCGVFVAPDQRDLPFWVFTSYHSASYSPFQDLQNPTKEHVSLELGLGSYIHDQDLPSLRTRRWINGLCFFSRMAVQKVVFPWPDAFL